LEARERTVNYYLPLPAGTPAPFSEWRDGYGDVTVRTAITARVARFRGGNFSDSRSLGNGLHESRIDHGPGYRIYYGNDGDDIVLVFGGEKSSQTSDISIARDYWNEYKERKKQNAKTSKLQSRSPRRSSRRR
jgi:putative addiction module killer protein